MKEMSQLEIGYHAAAIDGEGSICICTEKGNKNPKYKSHVSVSNTNKLLLEYLYNTSKIGKIGPGRQKNILKYKNCWIWNLRVHELKPYLLQIKNYLIIKKIQADLMLEFLELYKDKNNYAGKEVPENIIIQRMVIYEEMVELNKRGSRL